MSDAGNGQSAFPTVYRSMVYRTTADICISSSTMYEIFMRNPAFIHLTSMRFFPPFFPDALVAMRPHYRIERSRTRPIMPLRGSPFSSAAKISTLHRDRFIVSNVRRTFDELKNTGKTWLVIGTNRILFPRENVYDVGNILKLPSFLLYRAFCFVQIGKTRRCCNV